MAENVAAVASGAVLPELDLDRAESPRAAKRRQSPSPDPSTKRPRLSADGDLDSPSTLRASPNVSPTAADPAGLASKDANLGRRESNAHEERKRGRRLFGGLLNTLSQSASNTQQKKRLEIEKRQLEKARLQKAEDESRRAERLQKLTEVRTREQVKFDEQSMRIRHSNMLAMAQFLCTKCEPKLYYKPWKLLPGDTERITEQIADTEALIKREILEFNKRHRTDLRLEERPRGEGGGGEGGEEEVEEKKDSAGETEGEHHTEPSPLVPLVAESEATNPLPAATDATAATTIATPVQAQAPQSSHVHAMAERDPLEENGEVVVEGDEDTVIY